MLNLEGLYNAIKAEANSLGFNHMGVALAYPVPHIEEYQRWIQENHHAGMAYMTRKDAIEKRTDPKLILEGCQRIICLAIAYAAPQGDTHICPPGWGRISAYARTIDYHNIIWEKLDQLESFIHAQAGEGSQTKSYVDTGPILERSFASSAGIGIAGKNTNLIIKGYGSYFFLAEILTDLPLPIDQPFTRDLCGACRRCIEACPTGCIREDHTIDAGRWTRYLTIENKGIIPDDLKTLIGSWLFGCDMCHMVCPHNTQTPDQTITLGEPILPKCIDLIDLFSQDEHTFKILFQETPLMRAKRQGLLRNAAVVLGNQRYQPALPILNKALLTESNKALLDACLWAVQKIETVD